MLHFGCSGLANGLAVLSDEETWSDWDHITGECFAGPHEGRVMDWWPVRITTLEQARREQPGLGVLISSYRSVVERLVERFAPRAIGGEGFLPPHFRVTMAGRVDRRLDGLRNGLGVIDGGQARFYPMDRVPAAGLEDRWADRILVVRRRPDGVPYAAWKGGGEPEMQLLSRWYGFSFTWPGCAVVEGDESER